MKLLDTRFLHTELDNLPDDEYFWKLMEPAWYGESKGTNGQRLLATITFFFREIANGGLKQALWNFEPQDVDLVIRNLDCIGAEQIAKIIHSGFQVLLGDNPPSDLDERRKIIDTKTQEWLDKYIEPYNEQLYDEERLWPYFRSYIEQNPMEYFRD